MNNTKQLGFIYGVVVLIWSTTPLAISWSVEGVSSWFSLMSRMAIGALVCLIILIILKQQLPINKAALNNYLVASIGIWLTMGLVYLAVNHINSGFISVIFGFTPLFTGLFAMLLLKQASFTPYKLLGMLIGFIGLIFIYKQSLNQNDLSFYGLTLIFLAMFIQALVSVMLKKINAQISALQTTTGALLFGLLPLILLWFVFDGTLPNTIDNKSLYSIIYLGILGSVIGFIGYYHIIKHLNINQVGLLPLITPIFALMLGFYFNNETLNSDELIGVSLIIIGLFIYQFLTKKPL